MKSHQDDSAEIREAVGVFVGAGKVHEAIDELLASGFHREELGLLAGEYTVRQSLGDFYTQTNQFSDDADAPNTAFVARESVGDTVHAYLGTMYFTGTTVAAGAAVATAAVLGGALVAAAAGVAAMGAIGGALAMIVHESDAEALEEQVEEGHLLLFVRTRDTVHEKQAVGILKNHTPIDVRVVSAPARS